MRLKRRGLETERPVKPNRRSSAALPAVAGVIHDSEGRLLVMKRNDGGLLGGLWGFPGGLARDNDPLADSLKEAVANLVGIEITVGEALLSFRHAYSHFSITLHAYRCELHAGTPSLSCAQVRWAHPAELDHYPSQSRIERLQLPETTFPSSFRSWAVS
jgi:A/G-specific adenine glycosylase